MRRLFVSSIIMAAVITGVPVDSRAAAQRSTLDLQRSDAAAIFGSRLDALGQIGAQIADEHEKYEHACRAKVTTAHTTTVLARFSRRGVWVTQTFEISNESTPTCRMLVADIKTHSQQIVRELERIDEDARRRSIFPGVMRDLKRVYGFE